MYKLVTWAYELGKKNCKNNILKELEKVRDFHYHQAQLKEQREYDERDTGFKHKVTPKNHEQRQKAIEEVLNTIDPKQYPNVEPDLRGFLNYLKQHKELKDKK